MRPFQAAILIVFGLLIVGGVVGVATFGKFGGDEEEIPASAVIWGTLPESTVASVVNTYNAAHNNVLTVDYRELEPARFDQTLAESIAEGRGPDAVILSQAQLVRHQDKLYAIAFESYPERLYRDTYIEGADAFTTHTGILGFPVFVDPLVMYWNRTLFTNARIPNPPKYWDELLTLGESLTKKDEAYNISQSVAALGEYRNVTNAKEIVAALIMQAGDPISVRDGGNRVGYTLGDTFGLPEAPANAAMRFYTEFANPVKPAYSWNRSLPESRDMFLRGDLALYFGFGSELLDLQERNPNLNFDMAPLPQIRESTLATTFGNMYGIALLKQSKNIAGAYRVATVLSGAEASGMWSEASGLPPVRRDLLGTAPADPYLAILYKEALIARGFLDPDPAQSDEVFGRLVDDILSGRAQSISMAVTSANARLRNLLR